MIEILILRINEMFKVNNEKFYKQLFNDYKISLLLLKLVNEKNKI